MSIQSVLLPVLLQVALVFILLGWLAKVRRDAVNAGIRFGDIALSGEAFPPHARQVANCYANQFEMPVLFFLAVLFAIVLHRTGWWFVGLEWIFVTCRYAHALVHTTSNAVSVRGPLFLGSALAVAALWVLVGLGIWTSAA